MPRDRNEASTQRSRRARRSPSVAERIVWEALRGGRLGFKFRREHPVGGYRLDFYCAEARLAVEMDGEQHDPAHDMARDAERSSPRLPPSFYAMKSLSLNERIFKSSRLRSSGVS